MGSGNRDPLVGKVLGGCRIEKRVGSGGMGVVYLCRQLSLERPVVAKVLHGELTRREEFVKRFEREAKAAARLFHPNIVQVLDYGHQDGFYYILMEYVDGVTVKDMIEDRGTIPLDRTIRIVADVARGLSAAHRSGIVHRDVKPANVMINSQGVVKVADFGIAKPMDDAEEITQTNFLVGTVQYMSPEQCDGQDLDGRADIYSLGITFFQMLTGHRPFEGRSTVDLMRQHIHDPPPPLDRYVRGVPIEVARILSRMLAKMPGDRYASCEALVADLDLFAARRATDSMTPTQEILTDRSRKRAHERTAPPTSSGWGALLVLLLFVAAGAGYAYFKLGYPLPEVLARLRGGSTSDRPKPPPPRNGGGENGEGGQKGANKPDPELERALQSARGDLDAGELGKALSAARRGLEAWGPERWSSLVDEVETAIGRDMVRVPGGPAVLGDDNDPLASPRRTVEVGEFWIDRHEVTQEAYARYLRATGADEPKSMPGGKPEPGKERHPVVGVSLDEARAFAEWAGKRLPTEEEWEKAARGADGRPFPWGEAFDPERAVTLGETVVTVDSLPESASPCGAEMMIGNVWEWTASRFEPYEGSTAPSGSFPPGKFVVRGGGTSMLAGILDEPRAWTRTGMEPDKAPVVVGFRCAWDGPGRD